METLLDALTLYAAENLIPRFQRETAAQTRTAWHKVDQLVEQLRALSPEADQYLEQLCSELLTIDFNHERATLRAGLSIGLELGRLV